MAVFPSNTPDRTGNPLGFMTAGNFARGSLSAGLAAGAATAQVSFDPVAAGYPASGYLIISRGGVPREVVKYSGRSASGGNPGSFTGLTRGQAGSSDQSHVAGDELGMGLFYGVIDDIINELIAGLTKLGTGASTPATTSQVLRVTGAGQSGWGLLDYAGIGVSRCHAYASGTQSLSTDVVTALALDTTTHDLDPSGNAQHSNVTNNTRLTCKTAGYYIVGAGCVIASNATGFRWGVLRKNGVTNFQTLGFQAPTGAGVAALINVTGFVQLAVNDYVELCAFQNSGGALDTATDHGGSNLWWVRVA